MEAPMWVLPRAKEGWCWQREAPTCLKEAGRERS